VEASGQRKSEERLLDEAPPEAAAHHPVLPVDELMRQLVDRAGEVLAAQDRLRLLLDANRSIVGALSLSTVLRRIAEVARDLVRARYAALGVIGADGLLEQFIHVGMDDATVRAIGHLPKGLGVLGALTEEAKPIRLKRIQDDERSSGFPPGHPPMESFLGVPIRSHDEIFGNLYLTEHEDGAFTAEDEDLVLSLAATAGIAIENARLYEDSRRRQRWAQASAEINEVLLDPERQQDPLELIAGTVKGLADADVVTLVVPAQQPETLRVAVATGDGEAELLGLHYPEKQSLVALAMETGRGVQVGSVDEGQGYYVHLAKFVDVGPVMAVPLSSGSGPRGALMLGRRKGHALFRPIDVEMVESFAHHAAVAIELEEARADKQRLAVLQDRDRIARDLHDHVIQRLFAAGLRIQSAAAMAKEPEVSARLGEVVNDIDVTIRQIRTSIFQLRESELAQRSLRTAVLEVVRQSTPHLGLDPSVQFAGPIDTLADDDLIADVQAVVREALSNCAQHANATQLLVVVGAAHGQLRVEVSDNGSGLGNNRRRSGLKNLGRRAEQRGGGLAIDQPEAGGTKLQWTIPYPQ
jgi:signal transduction histidine kinase